MAETQNTMLEIMSRAIDRTKPPHNTQFPIVGSVAAEQLRTTEQHLREHLQRRYLIDFDYIVLASSGEEQLFFISPRTLACICKELGFIGMEAVAYYCDSEDIFVDELQPFSVCPEEFTGAQMRLFLGKPPQEQPAAPILTATQAPAPAPVQREEPIDVPEDDSDGEEREEFFGEATQMAD